MRTKFKKNFSLRLFALLGSALVILFISLIIFTSSLNFDWGFFFNRLSKHNELNSEQLARQVLEICKNDFNWRDCYGKQVAKLNYQMQFKDSLKVLHQIEADDPKSRDCHLIAHRLATSEVEKSPQKWMDIFNYVDQTTCTNGFVHGVLEGRSKFDSSLILDEKTIPQICYQIEAKTSKRVGKMREGADDACAHVMGHILLAQDNGVIQDSVNECAKIPSDIRRGCFDGIFMENITRENLEAHGVSQKFTLNKSASLGLEENCKNYTGDSGLSCWRELAHIYTTITNNKPLDVYPLCYQNLNKAYAFECFMHSINLMILSDNYSDQDLADTCKNYWNDEKASQNCIYRSVFPLLSSSIDFIDRANIFCSSQPDKYKQYCFTKIGQELKLRTSKDKLSQLCSKLPKEFVNYCLLKS